MTAEARFHLLIPGRYGGPRLVPVPSGAANVWPAANRAFYVPFQLPTTATIQRVELANGNAVGNSDAGIYSAAGALLASVGTFAMTGTNVVEHRTLAASVTLQPGWYYAALLHSEATASYRGWATDVPGRYAGVLQQDVGATVLPATMTGVAVTTTGYPFIVLCTSASL